ncbi:16284_t:CDS:2 [Funneliformis geosporum]|uniref:16284_t:CDS:1 n=1 Tax=Funneliformis geosporum TaxID=1117311 RepID=A0A9W4X4J5_9GLOM|nr:16284_t:CDS:2 [Funneliformis geosporum]
MSPYTFRSKVEEYMKKAIKELEKVKKIADIEEQCNKISFIVRKHKQNLEELKQGKPEDISYYENYLPFNLDKYEKKVKELDVYWGEVAGKSNKVREQKQKEQRNKEYELKTSHCAYCKNKPPTDRYVYKENYTGQYKKSKKDGQKFCSSECFQKNYAENCDKCGEKALGDTYYSDAENKTGTLCSKCNNEYTCEECRITKEGRYRYHTIKNDNKKFCSKQCFNDHYSETCVDCRKKVYSPYRDKKYPELTYCFSCHYEAKKQGKELEKSSEGLGEAMDDLVDGMAEAVKKSKEDEKSLNVNDEDSKLFTVDFRKHRNNNLNRSSLLSR